MLRLVELLYKHHTSCVLCSLIQVQLVVTALNRGGNRELAADCKQFVNVHKGKQKGDKMILAGVWSNDFSGGQNLYY